ncbi:hypothetical protein [Kitasatospora griseola]|uniref:hypothetical protein n=1 Tax=Kitasatospora griseola TaxID=2064 RepID=UPI00380E5E23
MDETPQGGAGGVPAPERDREQDRERQREARREADRTAERAGQREEYRVDGRPPTVTHAGGAVPIDTLRRQPREAHRAEGRPPTVTHDWSDEEEAPAHRRRRK